MRAQSMLRTAEAVYLKVATWVIKPWVLYVLVAIAVWLPDGLNIGPVGNEDWVLVRHHGGVNGSLFDAEVARVFRDIPVWIGLHLTPRSFEGWQLMFLLLTAMRGILFYEIVKRIVPLSRYFAVACGLLAMFHPADRGYFLLNTTGVQFSLVLALASCLCALVYLENNKWPSLLLAYVFQFLSGFTYSAFIPILFSLPAGAWLLSRLAGNKPSRTYLVKIGAGVAALLAVEAYSVTHGVSKDAHVANFEIGSILDGYLLQSERIFPALVSWGDRFEPRYLFTGFLASLVTGILLWALKPSLEWRKQASPTLKWCIVFTVGLIALAAIAYFPYALSTSRSSDRRQLLLAGLFIYTALLFPIFLMIERRVAGWRVPVLVVSLIALLTVLGGLEKRIELVTKYRSIEAMLSSIATVVPNPSRNTILVVRITDLRRIWELGTVYSRKAPLNTALGYLYGRNQVSAAVFGHRYLAKVTERGLMVPVSSAALRLANDDDGDDEDDSGTRKNGRRSPTIKWMPIPYKRLILVDYRVYQPSGILGPEWLKRRASSKEAANAVAGLPHIEKKPAATTAACRLLEKSFRPGYCHKSVAKPR